MHSERQWDESPRGCQRVLPWLSPAGDPQSAAGPSKSLGNQSLSPPPQAEWRAFHMWSQSWTPELQRATGFWNMTIENEPCRRSTFFVPSGSKWDSYELLSMHTCCLLKMMIQQINRQLSISIISWSAHPSAAPVEGPASWWDTRCSHWGSNFFGTVWQRPWVRCKCKNLPISAISWKLYCFLKEIIGWSYLVVLLYVLCCLTLLLKYRCLIVYSGVQCRFILRYDVVR